MRRRTRGLKTLIALAFSIAATTPEWSAAVTAPTKRQWDFSGVTATASGVRFVDATAERCFEAALRDVVAKVSHSRGGRLKVQVHAGHPLVNATMRPPSLVLRPDSNTEWWVSLARPVSLTLIELDRKHDDYIAWQLELSTVTPLLKCAYR